MIKENYAVIVDGFSSGAELVKVFTKSNIFCIHIQSTEHIPEVYIKSFDESAYVKNIILKNNLSEIIDVLKQFNPLFVITGSEPGVELADIIADKLQIPTRNSLDTSINRRDKYFMHEQLRKNNLKYLKHYKSDSYEDIIQWARKFNEWPLVTKPLKSAGGDNVKICYTEADIKKGFNAIMDTKPNLLNHFNKEVLIQEYISAPEFAINTVHYDGNPYLCEIFQFHKIRLDSGKMIYDYARLLRPEEYDNLSIEYAFKVAKSLGIDYGPMHAEIFITPNGPILVEAAARLMGANVPVELMQQCIKNPQAIMTALLYSTPPEFLRRSKEKSIVIENLRILFLISKTSGRINKINYLDKIKSLRSFYAIKLRVKDEVCKTIDYDTSPGLVYLSHPDKDVIENDYLIIRDLENNNMYEVLN